MPERLKLIHERPAVRVFGTGDYMGKYYMHSFGAVIWECYMCVLYPALARLDLYLGCLMVVSSEIHPCTLVQLRNSVVQGRS